MYKIAVMGDRNSIYGFGSIGLDIYPVTEYAAATRCLNSLIENDYALIYMTEQLFSVLEEEVKKLEERTLPAIIPIPGVAGNSGIGMARIKKFVERAVGSDIIFGE